VESQSQTKKKRISTLFWARQKLKIDAIKNINWVYQWRYLQSRQIVCFTSRGRCSLEGCMESHYFSV